LLKLIKNSHWLQTIAAKSIAAWHPNIVHNIDKIAGLKKAFYLVNLENVPGDYMEFGMFEGTSFIGAFESHLRTKLPNSPNRKFWGYDSFEGFKYSDENDAHPFFREGDFKSSENLVRKRIKKHFKKKADWEITKGYVEDTIGGKTAAEVGAPKVAVAFIDLDLGAPARVVLETIHNSLQRGSIIIFDDYFAYRGRLDRGVVHAFESFKKDFPQYIFRRLYDYGMGGQAFIVSDTGREDAD
jgi:O-methyltransferase